jgi:hypothetical protein
MIKTLIKTLHIFLFINSRGKLSKEYATIKHSTEKMEFVYKHFGKNGIGAVQNRGYEIRKKLQKAFCN